MASIKFYVDNNLLLISQGSIYGDNYKEIKFKELFNSSNE